MRSTTFIAESEEYEARSVFKAPLGDVVFLCGRFSRGGVKVQGTISGASLVLDAHFSVLVARGFKDTVEKNHLSNKCSKDRSYTEVCISNYLLFSVW